MTTAAIREKLHDLINTADDRQVKAVYAIFEDELADKNDPWQDEDFVKEIEQRVQDFESGKVKGIPWEEVKQKALNRLKGKHE